MWAIRSFTDHPPARAGSMRALSGIWAISASHSSRPARIRSRSSVLLVGSVDGSVMRSVLLRGLSLRVALEQVGDGLNQDRRLQPIQMHTTSQLVEHAKPRRLADLELEGRTHLACHLTSERLHRLDVPLSQRIYDAWLC